MKNKKLITLISALCLFSSCAAVCASVAWFIGVETIKPAYDSSIKSIASYFDSVNENVLADGTESNPYVITKPVHLHNLMRIQNDTKAASQIAGLHFEIGKIFEGETIKKVYNFTDSGDIGSGYSTTLNMKMYDGTGTKAKFRPIGVSQKNNPFSSILEGNNIVIDNLSVKKDGKALTNYGVFGYVTSDASISNLSFSNLTVTVSDHNASVNTGYFAGSCADFNNSFSNVNLTSGKIVTEGKRIISDYGFFGKNSVGDSLSSKGNATNSDLESSDITGNVDISGLQDAPVTKDGEIVQDKNFSDAIDSSSDNALSEGYSLSNLGHGTRITSDISYGTDHSTIPNGTRIGEKPTPSSTVGNYIYPENNGYKFTTVTGQHSNAGNYNVFNIKNSDGYYLRYDLESETLKVGTTPSSSEEYNFALTSPTDRTGYGVSKIDNNQFEAYIYNPTSGKYLGNDLSFYFNSGVHEAKIKTFIIGPGSNGKQITQNSQGLVVTSSGVTFGQTGSSLIIEPAQKVIHQSPASLKSMDNGYASIAAGETFEMVDDISDFNTSNQFVLGLDPYFHSSGTSSWGVTATSGYLYYKISDISTTNKTFRASTTINGTTYYLTVPTSNTFSMSTTASDLKLGTTYSNTKTGEIKSAAIANCSTTTRHLRKNGTNGLRSYAGDTGNMAYFYKVISDSHNIVISGDNKVTIGGTTQLTASCTKECNISWSSSNTSVATITQNGLVSGISEGVVTITASCSEASATFSIIVADLPTFTITENDLIDFTNKYDWYTAEINDCSFDVYGYKNGGIQMNIDASKDRYPEICNTTELPGNLSWIELVATNTTTRTWHLRCANTAYSKDHDYGEYGTEIASGMISSDNPLCLSVSTGDYKYFLVYFDSSGNNAPVLSEINIKCASNSPAYIIPSSSNNVYVGQTKSYSINTESDGTGTAITTGITWGTSNSSIFTVSGGTITAKKAGEANLSATVSGYEIDAIKVTVTANSPSITCNELVGGNIEGQIDDEIDLSITWAQPITSSYTVTWSTNSSSYFTISNTTSLTPKLTLTDYGSGTNISATITCEGETYNVNRSVTSNYQPVTGISFINTKDIEIGGNYNFASDVSLSPSGKCNPNVTYSITTVGAVSGTDYTLSGSTLTILNGTSFNNLTIRVTSVGDPSFTSDCTVNILRTPTVDLNEDSINEAWTEDETLLVATVSNITNPTIDWSISAGGGNYISLETVDSQSNKRKVCYNNPYSSQIVVTVTATDPNNSSRTASDTFTIGSISLSEHSLALDKSTLEFDANDTARKTIKLSGKATGHYKDKNQSTIRYDESKLSVYLNGETTLLDSNSTVIFGSYDVLLDVVPKQNVYTEQNTPTPITFTANGDTATCNVTINAIGIADFDVEVSDYDVLVEDSVVITAKDFIPSVSNKNISNLCIEWIIEGATFATDYEIDSGNKAKHAVTNSSDTIEIYFLNSCSITVTAKVTTLSQPEGISITTDTITASYIQASQSYTPEISYTGENLVGEGYDIYWKKSSDVSPTWQIFTPAQGELVRFDTTDGYKVVTNLYEEQIVPVDNGYQLLTSASDLTAGDKVVITATVGSNMYAMSDQRDHNWSRSTEGSVSLDQNKLVINHNVEYQPMEFTVEEGTNSNTFAFKHDDGYLTVASSKSNDLVTSSSITVDSSFELDFSEGATGQVIPTATYSSYARDKIFYNDGNNAHLFSAYGSKSTELIMYVSIYYKHIGQETDLRPVITDVKDEIVNSSGIKPINNMNYDVIGYGMNNEGPKLQSSGITITSTSNISYSPVGVGTFTPTESLKNTMLVYIPRNESNDYGTLSVHYSSNAPCFLGLDENGNVEKKSSNNKYARSEYMDVSLNYSNIEELSICKLNSSGYVVSATSTSYSYYVLALTAPGNNLNSTIIDVSYDFAPVFGNNVVTGYIVEEGALPISFNVDSTTITEISYSEDKANGNYSFNVTGTGTINILNYNAANYSLTLNNVNQVNNIVSWTIT